MITDYACSVSDPQKDCKDLRQAAHKVIAEAEALKARSSLLSERTRILKQRVAANHLQK
jgi:hypothetical protein